MGKVLKDFFDYIFTIKKKKVEKEKLKEVE